MAVSLARVNHDSSWLLAVGDVCVVLDPWILGSNIDFSPHFSKQDHILPVVPIPDLISLASRPGAETVVAVSHRFSDHFSRETLVELPRSWRAICEPRWALGKVKGLRHFGTVLAAEEYRPGLTLSTAARVPVGKAGRTMSMTFFRATGITDVLHNLVLFSFFLPGEEKPEAVVAYSPHGFRANTLMDAVAFLAGRTATVLVCTISEYRIPELLGGTLNLGLDVAVGIARALGPKAVLDTHSEDKTKEGYIGGQSQMVPSDHARAQTAFAEAGTRYIEPPELGKWVEV
ncbi:hypothetical protein DFJ74DRAFT_706883 [Hyaloraphidium curvatum]|nr:hypothetical protein DFJ74DRAFT_706883 [Hyaloraphidium curvatum]